jgi:hypothetical protein
VWRGSYVGWPDGGHQGERNLGCRGDGRQVLRTRCASPHVEAAGSRPGSGGQTHHNRDPFLPLQDLLDLRPDPLEGRPRPPDTRPAATWTDRSGTSAFWNAFSARYFIAAFCRAAGMGVNPADARREQASSRPNLTASAFASSVASALTTYSGCHRP